MLRKSILAATLTCALSLAMGGTAMAIQTVKATNSNSFNPGTAHVSDDEKVV